MHLLSRNSVDFEVRCKTQLSKNGMTAHIIEQLRLWILNMTSVTLGNNLLRIFTGEERFQPPASDHIASKSWNQSCSLNLLTTLCSVIKDTVSPQTQQITNKYSRVFEYNESVINSGVFFDYIYLLLEDGVEHLSTKCLHTFVCHTSSILITQILLPFSAFQR